MSTTGPKTDVQDANNKTEVGSAKHDPTNKMTQSKASNAKKSSEKMTYKDATLHGVTEQRQSEDGAKDTIKGKGNASDTKSEDGEQLAETSELCKRCGEDIQEKNRQDEYEHQRNKERYYRQYQYDNRQRNQSDRQDFEFTRSNHYHQQRTREHENRQRPDFEDCPNRGQDKQSQQAKNYQDDERAHFSNNWHSRDCPAGHFNRFN